MDKPGPNNTVCIERARDLARDPALRVWVNNVEIQGCHQVLVDAVGNVELKFPSSQLIIELQPDWRADQADTDEVADA